MDMNNLPGPDREAFEAVCEELKHNYNRLTLRHVGLVFGQAFWELLTISLIDAKYSMLAGEIEEARKQKLLVEKKSA